MTLERTKAVRYIYLDYILYIYILRSLITRSVNPMLDFVFKKWSILAQLVQWTILVQYSIAQQWFATKECYHNGELIYELC